MTFSNDKEIYAKSGQNRAEWPVFMQKWWLDAVAPSEENWSCALVFEGKELLGAMPFFREKKFGFSRLGQPPMSPWTGCWIANLPHARPNLRFNFEKKVISALLENRPKTDFLKINFQPEFRAAAATQTAGLGQTIRYTFQINFEKNNGNFSENFNRNLRRNLAKGRQILSISATEDLDLLYFLSKKKWGESDISFSKNKLEKIDNALKINALRKILIARNTLNEPVGAIYFTWNSEKCDLLISASDSNFREVGVIFNLLETALYSVKNETKIFDFNGSMTASVAAVFEQFGAEVVPYSCFFKGKNRLLEAVFMRRFF